ncbi:hypothetical protein BDN72DRAFT_822391 [Pluteus cervinus]|uniref:Uncharacterized protein n=1 Tax=Pluteus cervinus TaxID=181527 RepID=A0ACD3AND9_9AGAR|nr:hypothetical protein BDN72DRAFT_822391 [Pluteus cervinus]
MKPITFYDLTSRLRTKAWSPNTWKTRYTLNYKRLPYTTEWVQMESIAAVYKQTGAEPTQHKRDGTPIYTLPVIFDPNTNRAISDSLQITNYLDKQYPDTPPLIQLPGLVPQHQAREMMLQAAFVDSFGTHAMGSLWQFMLLRIHDNLHDETRIHFRTTRGDV